MLKKKVLIADDHALVREGIAAFLKLCDEVEVVAEASDGVEALEKTARFRPDIIIMDINMPKLGGLEATIEIKKLYPDVKVLVLTQYEDREYISRFLKAGVSGYLLKKAVGSDLIAALKAIMRGELYLYSSIAT
ncbi:MAG TPA: response regulator transcription factor, partial [Nitrospirota bacterium]|nr:response regulator transcription factor [Nitrospirota bacterium]